MEALLTFTSDNPGGLVSGVAVNPGSVTLRQHHSFIQLPDDGYRTRIADPRVGVNGPTIFDYATPIDEDLRLRLAARHRLQKRNPGPEPSEPVEPIVYYLDPGTPEPIRSALIEGAAWWAGAFEAAGFVNAYRVEVLPEGVDPQDIRYNMIHWTHRRTRGYSYGNTVTDPRTGEIIRGVVMEAEGIQGTLVLWPGVAEEQLASKAWYVRDGYLEEIERHPLHPRQQQPVGELGAGGRDGARLGGVHL